MLSSLTTTNLYQILLQLTARTKLYVAYSGGVDSHVLLHMLASLRNNTPAAQFEITAIHIDHGFHSHSHEWATHCQKICQQLQIPYIVRSFKVREQMQKKEGLEAAARRVRYEEFRQILPPDAALLTAHHADDQAETVLLQLLRGSGPKGLAAIAMKSKLGEIELLRPLLTFSRAEILQYASQHNLSWIEDASNEDISFNRNYLRHKVIPLLKDGWSGLLGNLGRVAQNCAETNHLLDILAEQDIAWVRGDVADTLSVGKLLAVEPERQRNVIRYWLRSQKLSAPSRVKTLEIQRAVLNSNGDRLAYVAWDGVEVRRYHGNLYAMLPVQQPDPTTVLSWNLSSPLTLPYNMGVLKVKTLGSGVEEALDLTSITVRFRVAGAKCKPKGRKTHSLKNLFQEWRIPPWQRSCIPLIYQGDRLMVVVGHCICEDWSERVKFEWLSKK